MITQSEAIIYLAEQRKKLDNLFITKMSGLSVVDNTMGGNQSKASTYISNENRLSVIWPFVGDLDISIGEKKYKLEEDQLLSFSGKGGIQCIFSNPYLHQDINFLEFYLEPSFSDSPPLIFDLNTQLVPDQLTTIAYNLFLGKYHYRTESGYLVKNTNSKINIFILHGSFEVQDRLLQSRDGLTIWNIEELEFQALEENSILLIAEC